MKNSEVSQHFNHTSRVSDSINTKSKRFRKRGIIYFRSIQPNDRRIIQQLHEQWFPVDYKSEFFDGLCNSNVMPGTNEPLYSCVACFKELGDDELDDIRERERYGCMKRGVLPFLFGRRKQTMSKDYVHVDKYGECILWESLDEPMSYNDVENGYNDLVQRPIKTDQKSPLTTDSCASYCKLIPDMIEREKILNFYNKMNDEITSSSSQVYLNDAGEQIIGCLVGSFLSSSRPSAKHEFGDLLVQDPEQYPRMFYIMTLGTVPEFRRVGLGSILVNRVVDMIYTRPECGALYLHVITYNKGGN
jgi:ribosomal protein S18 acetylase RimI-like enzyme